jgi:leader peptidase (prepilin peptidase)/N-methyltransferase
VSDLYLNSNFIVCMGFIVGGVFGSFLNVCAYRIPIGKSVITPPSHCPNCGENIPWYRNLPFFTWIIQRGVAGCCSFKIPFRYWFVELMMGLFFAYFAYLYSKDADLFSLVIRASFTWLMLVVAVTDFETMIIPDRFSAGGAFAGVLLSFYFPAMHLEIYNPSPWEHLSSGMESVSGMLIGSALLYWIGAIAQIAIGREALGEGDVKLLGCIGAFCGWQGAIFAIFGGALLGTALILPVMFFQRLKTSQSSESSHSKIEWGGEIPFGPFLAFAGLIYHVYASVYVDLWFNSFQSNF